MSVRWPEKEEATIRVPHRLRCVPEAPGDGVIEGRQRFGSLVGSTPEMLALFRTLERYAGDSESVLIRGETGTGKERVARSIHDASPRRHQPFVAMNCAAFAESLVEAEMFGYTRGAFTGAVRNHKGYFEQAEGGTLLLDEVAEMSRSMQAKLLRVLETKEVQPLGSGRARRVDVRMLYATHADLEELMKRGEFREDLYYRIAPACVKIPPLRRRTQDMGLLVQNILEEFGRPEVILDEASMALLRLRSWPGNVRELRNLMAAALRGFSGNLLSLDKAWSAVQAMDADVPETKHETASTRVVYEEARQAFELRYWTDLCAAHRGNVTRMARSSGRSRVTVGQALRKYGLSLARSDAPRSGAPPPDSWRKNR
jgi:transcriptional regulator with PAS, ATPase and Fis domain